MKLGIIIGRFQPVHEMHLKYLFKPALEECDHVLVLLGSSFTARNIKNPWTSSERTNMILGSVGTTLGTSQVGKLHFRAVKDYPYSDNRWCYQIQHLVNEWAKNYPSNSEVTLYGSFKDDSSYYLDLFPQWSNSLLDVIEEEFSSTLIRDNLFSDIHLEGITQSTREALYEWCLTPEGERISNEYEFVQRYKEQFESLPYPPIFQTVDNVVLWRGHVLLIKRRSHPGKGLWALPGGFLDANERIKDAAIRELQEETRIKFRPHPNASIKKLQPDSSWITEQRTFDYPGRSLRGRTITTAFLWVIPEHLEIQIEAGSDAAKVQWFELYEVLSDKHPLFEDHQAIVANMALNS
jgi:bifunctional NMN adenylyltransferase/nudix hydrolase